MNSAKCSMSASVTGAARPPPCRRSAGRRAACGTGGAVDVAFVPGIQRPVTAARTRGLACTAVRCRWCRTLRMPPAPRRRRPGPGRRAPASAAGNRARWTRPRRRGPGSAAGRARGPGRGPRSRAKASSAVTTEPARLPRPSAASSIDIGGALVADQVPPARTPRPRAAAGPRGVVGPQQHGRDEGAALGAGADHVDLVRVAEDERAGGPQGLDARRTSSRCSRLASAPMSTPSVGRGADDHGASCSATASATAQRAGTKARLIAVHFCPALTVISVTSWSTYRSNSGVPGPGVRAEDGAVQRVGLGVEPDRPAERWSDGCAAVARWRPTR